MNGDSETSKSNIAPPFNSILQMTNNLSSYYSSTTGSSYKQMLIDYTQGFNWNTKDFTFNMTKQGLIMLSSFENGLMKNFKVGGLTNVTHSIGRRVRRIKHHAISFSGDSWKTSYIENLLLQWWNCKEKIGEAWEQMTEEICRKVCCFELVYYTLTLYLKNK